MKSIKVESKLMINTKRFIGSFFICLIAFELGSMKEHVLTGQILWNFIDSHKLINNIRDKQ